MTTIRKMTEEEMVAELGIQRSRIEQLEGERDNLAVQIGSLADTILELELRGDEDGGACEIAAIRLRENELLRDKAAEIGQKLADANIVDPEQTGDGFDALDTLITKYREIEGERDTLRNALTDAERAAADAALKEAKKAKAVPEKRSDKARKIGAIRLKKDEKPLDKLAIAELISAADVVEIAFSDGEKEIAAIGSRRILGDAWVDTVNGLKLQVPEFTVFGPPRGEAEAVLDGYGLLLDGELVAYAKRSDKLTLRPGGQYDLKDDVIFG